MTNLEKAKQILKASVEGNVSVASAMISDHYIEHDPRIGGGKNAFLQVVQKMHALKEGREREHKHQAKATIMRSVIEGDYVVLHIHYEHWYHEKAYVSFEIFKFNNNLLVEHWDGFAPIMPANPSGRTQLDGTVHHAHQTNVTANKKIVKTFQELLIAGKGLEAAQMLHPKYIQHNPNAVDTRDGMIKLFAANAARNIHFKFQKIHHLIGENDFVFMTSDLDINGKAYFVYDLYRVENNLIAEHWDVIEAALPTNEQVNKNSRW